ncbi:hypothetical protein TCDM_12430 [Trypanosoma cruzi Dm28c]|uniref:Uncharacterized protein n=1 Tax=Trypanosoma cruzi Dm28c TaxID=1416333 RepID=V5APJ8_TRYCR|nr:hypothetical protein TCDM_12430 [Trypanosoma cruzi Dm28c]
MPGHVGPLRLTLSSFPPPPAGSGHAATAVCAGCLHCSNAREHTNMCVWAVCVLLVLSVPSNFTVAISVCLLSFLACVCVQHVEKEKSGNTSDTSVGSRAEHPCGERDTRESGRNSAKHHRLHTSPHAQTHTHKSQCCQFARGRIRPSTQKTRASPAFTHNGRGKETHRHHLQFGLVANGIRPRPRSQHKTLTVPVIAQRATRRSGSASIHDVATKFPAITPTTGFGARLKEVTGGASRQQQK